MAAKGKKGTQRKLTAILCADVVGYSRLMGDDEEATIETLTAYRKVFTSEIKKHRGRVVDAKGDAILAEFASVVDAVNGAVEIQRELAEKNAELPDERRMDFRIGINLGDVVVKDDAIYGDGVNVAARLESLAEPGGVCISRPVHDQVKGKLKLKYEFLGKEQVKNIAEPVWAYWVGVDKPAAIPGQPPKLPSGEQIVMRPKDAPPLNLPEKPSIAVLPFANMSSDSEQEYFSDGLTEDIITALAKIPRMFVIARNSTFAYKGRATDVKQIGRDLGVQYVLEGSVRRAGDQIRITSQLIEAQTGSHLWAERYDRVLSDIFSLQDEIVSKILIEMRVKLTEGEQAHVFSRCTDDPVVLGYLWRGRDLQSITTNESNSEARRWFTKALEIEPQNAAAYSLLGFTHFWDFRYGWSNDLLASLKEADSNAQKAIALDETYGTPYSLLGSIRTFEGKHDEGIELAQRGVELFPNSTACILFLAFIQRLSGQAEESVDLILQALRLSPNSPGGWLFQLGESYRIVGKYEEAITALKQVNEISPNLVLARVCLIAACMQGEREDDARKLARDFHRLNPKFQIELWAKRALPYKDPAVTERIIDLCKQAGLPE